MFVLKKVLGALLMPLPVAAALVCTGLLARTLRRRRASNALMAAGAILTLISALSPVGSALLLPLESRYAAIRDASTVAESARYVVVLGSGYRPRDGVPVTAALDSVAVVRLAEAIRLFRQLPGAALVVSGGTIDSGPSHAQGYAEAARALGVPADSIVTIDDPIDTAAEIRAIHDRFGSVPILLITSASHMPRAMAHCRRLGVNAIPAPTAHLSEPFELLRPQTWVPSGVHLRKTETAVHEYLGLFALNVGVR